MQDWQEQRSTHNETNQPSEPIEVTDYQVEGEKQRKKSGGGRRVVATGLVCMLLGSFGGGAFVQGLNMHQSGQGLFSGGDNSSTVLYSGQRPEVELKTVSTADHGPLSTAELYASYVDSCVGISVDIVSTNYFGQTVRGAAAGSGFVVTQDGYIVTNYHVVENANAITVSFEDGSSYPASYIGGDQESDVAVLKIEATGLHPVILGDSDNMNVGETVSTIGNPLGELTFSQSDGIVSALERSITLSDGSVMNTLQTNCAINSGNSGGPLFNSYGEVIGIVSAKYSSSDSAYSGTASVEGLGFAIPINDVKSMIQDIIELGYISGRPFLGVYIQNVEQGAQRYGIPAGAEVLYATPGLAAARDGIQEGDIITAVNGESISSTSELIDTNNSFAAGEQVDYEVYRDGKTLTVTVTLDERTAELEQKHTEYYDQRIAQDGEDQSQNQNQSQGQSQQGQDDYDQFLEDFLWPYYYN